MGPSPAAGAGVPPQGSTEGPVGAAGLQGSPEAGVGAGPPQGSAAGGTAGPPQGSEAEAAGGMAVATDAGPPQGSEACGGAGVVKTSARSMRDDCGKSREPQSQEAATGGCSSSPQPRSAFHLSSQFANLETLPCTTTTGSSKRRQRSPSSLRPAELQAFPHSLCALVGFLNCSSHPHATQAFLELPPSHPDHTSNATLLSCSDSQQGWLPACTGMEKLPTKALT